MIERKHEPFIAPREAAAVAAVAKSSRDRAILVQASCGQVVLLEVPMGMTEQQALAEFVRGQLITLAVLSAGIPLLFILMLLR